MVGAPRTRSGSGKGAGMSNSGRVGAGAGTAGSSSEGVRQGARTLDGACTDRQVAVREMPSTCEHNPRCTTVLHIQDTLVHLKNNHLLVTD